MHLTIKERVELVLMSGADGVCYYYLNCFICFGALFMAHPVYQYVHKPATGPVKGVAKGGLGKIFKIGYCTSLT